MAVCLALAAAGGAEAAVIHVPADQPTIQQAIDAAGTGDTVLVAPGTYLENLQFLGKAITLTSESGPDVTTLDGGGVDTVITFQGGEGPASVVHGFTIRRGAAAFGAGMLLVGASPTITGNVFDGNAQGSGGFGAAIAGNGASPIVDGNVFRNNTCDAQATSGVVTFVNGSSPSVTNNVFANNQCRAITMDVPAGNAPQVANNTIVGNHAGILAVPSALQVYRNNIVAGNGIGLEVDSNQEGNAPTWTNNLVFGNDTNYSGIADQTGIDGNLSADPLFVDQDAADYRLRPGSPAIDAGDDGPPALPATDVEGAPRVVAGHAGGAAIVDIGAYEFDPAGVLVTVRPLTFDFGRVNLGTTANQSFTVTNVGLQATAVHVVSAPPFAVDQTLALAPGASQTVMVTFTPAATGAVQRPVRFTDDAGTATRLVQGTGATIFTLTVVRAGDGDVTVTSVPAGITCGATCSAPFPNDAASGIVVTLSTTVAFGSALGGFTGCDTVLNGSCTLTLTANRTVTVTTGRVVPLIVTATGNGSGSVVSDPPGIDCGATCFARFIRGSSVRLTATAAPGSIFAGWSACDGTAACTVTLGAPRIVTARFVQRADLALTAISSAATAQTGRPLTVTTTIRNLGALAAPGFRMTFFMSPGDATPGAGTAVGFTDVPGLLPGAVLTMPSVVTVPIDFAAGAYYLSAVVDSRNEVSEIDESNNRLTAPGQVTVSLLRADLTITAVTAPATGQGGRPVALAAVVRNVGQVPAPPFRVTFFMSANDSTPGAGVAVGAREVPGLGVNASATVSVAAGVPSDLPPGAYFVSAVADSRNAVVELSESNNGRTASSPVVIGVFRPDLTVSTLTVPPTGQTGRPLTVSALVRNIGTAASGPSRLTVFMSPGDATPGAGVAVGSRERSGLGINASATVTLTVTVPIDLAAGPYFVSAVVDSRDHVTELNESNNGLTAPSPVVISLFRPDLALTAVTAPATGQTGLPVRLGAVVRNTGQVVSPGFRVAFFMSANSSTPGAGIALGSREISGLGVNVSATVTLDAIVPIDAAAGPYFVSAVADSRGVVTELSESNNGLTAPHTVVISLFRPDLSITTLTAPPAGRTGQPLNLAAVVRNAGQVPAPGFRVTFFMSGNDSTPGAGLAVGSSDLPGLGVNVSAPIAMAVTVPINFAAGPYFVSAVADSQNAVIELSESNNGRTAPTPVVISLWRADLTLTALTAPATGQTGRPLALSAAVRNVGQVASPPFRVTFFMSAGDATPAAGRAVGFRDLGSLGVNASMPAALTVTVPADLAPGAYFVSAVADSRGTVTELNEGNNGLTAATQVVVSLFRPDLTLTSVQGPPSGVAVSGRPIAVTSTVLNAGPAPSGGFRIAYYLSADTQLDATDVLLGTRTVSSIAAHGTSTVTSTFAVPAGTPSFDYYVIAVVDDALAVVELDETNNALASAATVAVVPNLVTSFPVSLTLTFSACSDPELNTTGTNNGVLRVTTQTGQTFSGRLTERDTVGGDTLAISLAFSGAVATTGQITGGFSLVGTFDGVSVLSGSGALSGSLLGPTLTGQFSAPLSIITGDTCQLAGSFTSRTVTSSPSPARSARRD